jgi:hypothetical protein
MQASGAFHRQLTSTGRRVTVATDSKKKPCSASRSNAWRKLLQVRGVHEDVLTAEARDVLRVVLEACDLHRLGVLRRHAFSAWAAWTKGLYLCERTEQTFQDVCEVAALGRLCVLQCEMLLAL